ncbi:MAG TPA: response regulator [Nitrospiraceae bacterium]|nr:response regulator [Nitrospiraceae bacterium]
MPPDDNLGIPSRSYEEHANEEAMMDHNEKRILLVEDDQDIRYLLCDLLTQEGYKVYEARNGSEALQAMNKRHYDVVLSDYHMPQMDGLTFLRMSQTVWPETPVILTSSDPNLMEQATQKGRGAYACLPKPFDLDRLLQVLHDAVHVRA